MDVLLPILVALFFAPVLVRLATRSGSRAKADLHGPLLSLRRPGLLIQAIGGLLLVGGTALAVATGRVQHSVSVTGIVGAATVSIATVLMSWSILTFRSWRLLPTLDADHQLCTTGPFKLVRHPIYLAMDLFGLGLAIWVPSLPMVLGALALAVGGDLRARAEERALLETFGDRYRQYMSRVRRTIPYLY